MSDGYDDIRALMDHDYYSIETHEDDRYIHVEEYIWDAREAGRTCYDEDDNEIDADVVVTEFTGCYIPFRFFLDDEYRKSLVMEYEADVQQYEGEYTFDQFMNEFPPSEPGCFIDAGTCYSAKHLPWDEITKDTPDGWYYS